MGTTIDALLDEKKRGYAPFLPLVNLYKEKIPVRFDEAVVKVRSHAEELIEYIENKAKTPIAKFTIGKSYARKMINRDFDPNNFDTWIKKGIKGRWENKYKKEGYNGLVVLCGITRELLPLVPDKRSKRHPLHDQQQYALALEQQLIHYFLFEAPDSRLGNDSLDKGKLAQSPYAGVVYLAFKLYTVREVWQLFQDAFEMKVEPDDTVFVINMPNGELDENQKKIIGGPRAENDVIAFVNNERIRINLRGIRIFMNYIPSKQFVEDLKLQDIIIARNFENATKTDREALEMLSYYRSVREFKENDWNDLEETLQLPIDGISHQRAIELEEFKTYLKKPEEEILEMFQEAMNETEKQKQEKAEPNDSVFVIRGPYLLRKFYGKNVENRVIHFLKERNILADNICMYVNYNPSINFEELIKTSTESTYLGCVSVLVGSKDKINEEFPVGEGKVKITTMTADDLDDIYALIH